MRVAILLTGVAAILLGGSPAATESTEEGSPYERKVRWSEVDEADGAVLFANLCASCHGEAGRGDGPVAEALGGVPDLSGIARRNGGKYPLHDVEKKIRGGVRAHGAPQMPVWGPALMQVRDDWSKEQQKAFVASRIRRLAEHVGTLQAEP